MKNIAIPIEVLKEGDPKKIAKYGPKKLTLKEIARRNADEIAHDEYVQKRKYRDDRAEEYPSIGEQIDELWKAIASLECPLPDSVTAMMAKIRAVKEKHPKAKER